MSTTQTMQPPALEKLLKLFTGPSSANLYERHLAALDKLCKTNAAGFAIKDLPQVQQLLELSIGIISKREQNDFIQPTETLMRALSKPFVKTASTDEFRLVSNITNMLACMAKVVINKEHAEQLRLAASQMLLIYASGYGTRPSALTQLPVLEELDNNSPLRVYLYNQRCLEQSGVVQMLVHGLATFISSRDDVMTMSISLALTQMSHHPGNAEPMIRAGLLQCMCSLLENDYSHAIVPVAVELIWNVLERAPAHVRSALTQPQPRIDQISACVTMADVVELPGTTATDEPSAQMGEASQVGDQGEVNLGEVSYDSSSKVEQVQSEFSLVSGTVAGASEESSRQEVNDRPLSNLSSRNANHQRKDDFAFVAPIDSYAEADDRASSRPLSRSTTASPARVGRGFGSSSTDLDPRCVVHDLGRVLSVLFRSILLNGYRAVDKELRNDILVVINLVMGSDHKQQVQLASNTNSDICGEAFCIACAAHGLFEPLLAVSTSPELGCVEHAGLVRAWALTAEESDQELKMLSWKACVAGCVHTGARGSLVALAKEWQLMRAFLAFIDISPDETAQPLLATATLSAQKRWQNDAKTALRVAALSRLHALAPLQPEVYLAEGGHTVVLRLLQMGSHNDSIEAALRHLHHLIQHAPEFAEVLGEGSGLRTFLDVLQDPGRTKPAQHYCLLMLSQMCKVNPENLRRLRREGGVLTLLGVLARCKVEDQTLPSAFTVAALDAAWSCVLADRKNTAKFLVEDGMDMLLELLEIGNKGYQAVLLCVLCDLLENSRSHTFFLQWKSRRDGRNGAQLLIQAWRGEEGGRGMTENGLLTNTHRPLSGTGKRTQWLPQEGITYSTLADTVTKVKQNRVADLFTHPIMTSTRNGSSRAGALITDMATMQRTATPEAADSVARVLEPVLQSGDAQAATAALLLEASTGERILAKVYGCFRLLGFQNFKHLSPTDAATLALIEMFVKFKQGEMWQSIHQELETIGVRPTSPDRERIDSGIVMSEALAKTVRDTQATLLARHEETERQKELQYFNNMITQKKLDQEARFYKSDKSQLTLSELRDAKAKREAMLKSSIQHVHQALAAESGLIGTGHA